jgi:hypothetical protein
MPCRVCRRVATVDVPRPVWPCYLLVAVVVSQIRYGWQEVFQQVLLPLLYQYLTHLILRKQGRCRSWRKAFDLLFQNLPGTGGRARMLAGPH